MSNLLIDLTLTNDSFIEGPESYSISLSSASSSTGANIVINNATVTTTINDTQGIGGSADGPGEWSITGPTNRDEGATATYTVALSGSYGVGEVISVDLDLTNVTANSSDYGNFITAVNAAVAADPNVSFNSTTGTLSYTSPSDGSSMADLSIGLTIVDDSFIEGSESFAISLSAAASSTGANVAVNASNSQVTTSINDTQGIGGVADGPGQWNISGPIAGDEGSTLQYTISLSGVFGVGESVSVDIDLNDVTTNGGDHGSIVAAIAAAASANPDVSFNSTSGTLTYNAPSDGAAMSDLLVNLSLSNDSFIEGPESYSISLSSASSSTGANVGINNASVSTTINDTQGIGGIADGPGEWSITGPTNRDEGATATYTVALSGSYGIGEIVVVDLDLTNISANSSDYGDFIAAINTTVAANPNVSFNSTTGTLTYTSPSDGASMANLVVDLPITNDSFIEGSESFAISLSSATSTTGANIAVNASNSQVTTTINDTQGIGGAADGPGEWNISGPVTGDEGLTVQYTVSLSGSFGAGEITSVDIDLSDLTSNIADHGSIIAALTAAASANPNVTFNSTTGTLTYTAPLDGASMSNLVIDLTLTNDSFIEGPESYSISLSSASSSTGANVGISNATVSTTINDTQGVGGIADGLGEWSITGPTDRDEGATATYTIALSGNYGVGEVVTVEVNLGTTTANANDYGSFITAVNTAVAGNPNISFNSTTGTLTYTSPADGASMANLIVDLAIVDDSFVEGSESFAITLGAASGESTSLSSTDFQVVTSINDTDGFGGSIERATFSIVGDTTVNEGGTASYTIALAQVLQAGEIAQLQLTLSNLDTNSADYASFATAVQNAVSSRADLSFNSSTGLLTYTGDGNPMANLVIDLDVSDDSLVEGPERYQLEITNASSPTGASITIDSSRDDVITTIQDTLGVSGALEEVIWSLGSDQTVEEGNSASYILSLGNGVLQNGEQVSVDIALADLSTNSSDYSNFVSAVDAAVSGYAGPGTLSFNTGTQTIEFLSDGAAMSDLTISLSTFDDSSAEGPEDFRVQISNATSSTNALVSISTVNNASITTIDDRTGAGTDEAIWSITGNASVDEGGSASYTIQLGGLLAINETATVELSLVNNTTQSSDYSNFISAVQNAVSSRADLTFSSATNVLTYTGSGSPMVDLTINLDATDDSLIEGPESFSINLTNQGSTSGILVGIDSLNDSSTTFVNDTIGVGGLIETADWSITGPSSVAEGSPINYTLSLAGVLQSGETATISLNLADIETNTSDYQNFATAIQNAVSAYAGPGSLAYNSGTQTLTFTSDGNAMVDLTITLATNNDTLSEGNERLTVGLLSPGSTTGATSTVAPGSTINTTIVDDDISQWSITGPVRGDEGATIGYRVSLSGTFGAGEQASVDIALSDIGTNPNDYANLSSAIVAAASSNPNVSFNPTTDTLTFTSPADGSGMSPFVISLELIDDALIEGPENFSIALSNPTTGSGIVVDVDSSAASVETTIEDTQGVGGLLDGPGQWSISSPVSVDEGGNAQIQVSLGGQYGAGEAVSVDIGLSNIDTNGSDYGDLTARIAAAVATNPDVSFNSTTGTLTYLAPVDGGTMSDLIIVLPISDDSFAEGPEDFSVSLSNAATTTGANISIATSTATMTINDTQGLGGVADALNWSIEGSSSIEEGGYATYILSLEGIGQIGEVVSIHLAIADLDTTWTDYGNFANAIQNAISGRSDLSFNSATGILTYTADGTPMRDVAFSVQANSDQLVEAPENYQIRLSAPSSSTGSETTIVAGSENVTTTVNTRETATGNTRPVANDDSAHTQVGILVQGDLLSNDGSPDGDFITVNQTPDLSPTNGVVIISPDGTFTYQPNTGFTGIDSFVYSIVDPQGERDTATVTIRVVSDFNGSANEAPIANDDGAIGQKNSPIIGNLLSNDSDPNGNPLTLNLVPIVAPSNGIVTLGTDGTFTYTPNDDYVGSDSFVYQVCDSNGACENAVVHLSVFDNPPVAADDINNTSVNTAVDGNVLSNDGDPNPQDTLTVNSTPVTGPTNGNLNLRTDGTYTYTPDNNFTGSDSFVYEVCDEGGNCTTASVTIEVRDTTPNNSPVANPDSATTFTDQPVSGSLISNDTDIDGDPLTVTQTPTAGPTSGSVTIQSDGSFTYTPNLGFSGTDSFDYEVCDDNGACDTSTMTINVILDTTPGNDPPIANDDTAAGQPNQTIAGNLLANDSDPNNDPLSITLTPVTMPTNGTVTINPDGSYAYVPNPGFIGSDSFEYEVCDDQGACSTAIVILVVSDPPVPNAPPIANDDAASTLQNTALAGDLTGNDGDPDGDIISIDTNPVANPLNGNVVIHSDGTFTYTPNAGFSGTDSFVYQISDPSGAIDAATVTITIVPDTNGPVNNPPSANNDAGIGQKNTAIQGNLLANDNDLNGDTLTINQTPVVVPAHGTLIINSDGSYTYTPDDDFTGSDSFVYEVCDSQGACDQAAVVLTIFDSQPIAHDDIVNTLSGVPVGGNVLSNDLNNDHNDDLSVNPTPVSSPIHGTVVLNGDGTFIYTPNSGFVGNDTFEYEVCDEGGNCDIGRVSIEVRDTVLTGNNAPPIANADFVTVFQDNTVTSSLISNDGDPTGEPIAINTTPVSNPANGSVVLHPNGTFTYSPNLGFIGSDSFVYEICDSQGSCDTAVVTIQVVADNNGPANDPPSGGDDFVISQKNTSATGNLLANDTDPNNDPLTINTVPVTAPSHGSVTINTDGTFTYLPDAGFAGSDSFEYEVCDDQGACTVVTAAVTIFNEPPVARNDQFSVIDSDVTGNVMTNDMDPNSDPLAANLVVQPQHGTVVWDSNGTFTYTPGPSYTGNDSFTYIICDDSGACASATVVLNSPFAFDSFTNQATDRYAFERSENFEAQRNRELLLSHQIGNLAPEPILAGYAQPGSILVGRIYDAHGALVDEVTTTVNRAGNWVMHFFDVKVKTNYVVMIEHISTEAVAIGDHHFRLTPATYRALQLGANHTDRATIGTILSDSPSNSLEIWHNQNVNPLRLL